MAKKNKSTTLMKLSFTPGRNKKVATMPTVVAIGAGAAFVGWLLGSRRR